MANRVEEGIVRAKAHIEGRKLSSETHKQLDRMYDLSDAEYIDFQNRKSIAAVDPTDKSVTPEEGQSIFILMGKSPADFNAQPLHIKLLLNQVYLKLKEPR